ncbi:MAG: Hpt domain-containing protein [Gammaproteobacteria bacterium]|nr:Hpt domain-containing protein [Gammaproteobacteria bacterium]
MMRYKHNKGKTMPTPITQYANDLPPNEADLFVLDPFLLFDEKEGIKLNGSKADLAQLLTMAIDEKLIGQDVDKMKAAHEANDWDKVQQLAHKIKGGAVYIGTVRLKMACQYLERYWKIGERAHLERLYQQVLVVVDETLEAIAAWLKTQ